MKNPQIVTRLNQMMQEEKISAINCILDYYKQFKPHLHNGDTFDMLYNMEIDELNNVLSDIISEIYAECNKFITRLNGW